MTERFPSPEEVGRIRAAWPKGTRVELERLDDPYTRLTPGERGTVDLVDDLGTIHITWDSGARLGIVEVAGDQIRRVPAPMLTRVDACPGCGAPLEETLDRGVDAEGRRFIACRRCPWTINEVPIQTESTEEKTITEHAEHNEHGLIVEDQVICPCGDGDLVATDRSGKAIDDADEAVDEWAKEPIWTCQSCGRVLREGDGHAEVINQLDLNARTVGDEGKGK